MQAESNVMYRFLHGFIIALSGNSNIIEVCSGKVPGWLQAGEKEKTSCAAKKEMSGETSSVFMTILGYLGKGIDFVCVFKYKIMTFLNLKFRRRIRRIRLFMQGKSTLKRMRWWGGDLWDGIADVTVKVGTGIADVTVAAGKGIADVSVAAGKGIVDVSVIAGKGIADVSVIAGKGIADAAVATANGIADATLAITNEIENIAKATANMSVEDIAKNLVAGAYKIGNLVADGQNLLKKTVGECLNFMKEKVKLVFKPFWDLVDKIKAKLMNYLSKSSLFKTLFPFAECFIGLVQVKESLKLIKTMTAVTHRVPQLAAGVGWIEVCVNLFCGWRQVQKGIEFLMKANDEPDPLEAYTNHGKFAGFLMEAIAGT